MASAADNSTCRTPACNTSAGLPPPFDLPELIAFTALQSPVIVLGLSLNLLLLILLAKNKKFHTTPYFLMASLAITDFGFLMLDSLQATVNMWSVRQVDRQFFLSTGVSCDVLAFVTEFVLNANCFNMAALAINRYIMIVHFTRYKSLYTRFRTKLCITGVYVVAFLWIAPVLVGWGGLGYDPMIYICKHSKDASTSHGLFISARNWLVIFILLVCYTTIVVKVRKSKKAAGNPSSAGPHKSEIALMVQFGLVILVYLFAWGFNIFFVAIFPEVLHLHLPGVALYLHFVNTVNAAVNPPIYFCFNTDLRKVLFRYKARRRQSTDFMDTIF